MASSFEHEDLKKQFCEEVVYNLILITVVILDKKSMYLMPLHIQRFYYFSLEYKASPRLQSIKSLVFIHTIKHDQRPKGINATHFYSLHSTLYTCKK